MLRENPFCWVTIPVADMDRAIAFYGEVFDMDLTPQQMGEDVMTMLPMAAEAPGCAGALFKGASDLKPGQMGSEAFFACAGDLAAALDRVEPAGGKALSEKIAIGPNGFIAHIVDTEGNRIGLHSTV